jgi:hypothetical protein
LLRENQLHYLVGYISRRYEQTKGERSRWCVPEVWRFAISLLNRKTRKVRE